MAAACTQVGDANGSVTGSDVVPVRREVPEDVRTDRPGISTRKVDAPTRDTGHVLPGRDAERRHILRQGGMRVARCHRQEQARQGLELHLHLTAI